MKHVLIFAGALQETVHKVAKTFSAIAERLSDLESRATALETDIAAACGQTEVHEAQLIDIEWKLEDYKNQQ
ncbi:hypothetical protein NDU88_010087 [Pleurodeles waltl]|uniref:Uncharacterized protein n=1 Tax=Pleurodeles waltl TaxID=8319 RepID=A0AAV7RYH5_PLEWA|nr:hypothetical protein NDU88_010087 [Pleurodeles waltl]